MDLWLESGPHSPDARKFPIGAYLVDDAKMPVPVSGTAPRRLPRRRAWHGPVLTPMADIAAPPPAGERGRSGGRKKGSQQESDGLGDGWGFEGRESFELH